MEALNNLLDEMEEKDKEIEKLKDKIKQYEEPEDMTLMYMWCNEKAKDEIKRLNNIINELEEDIKNYREILEQGITDKVDYIYLGSVLQFLDNTLDKLQELKGE